MCITGSHPCLCTEKDSTRSRFLAIFTSTVYIILCIISHFGLQARKAKGPAFLFVSCLEEDRKTGLRIKGKFKLLSQQHKRGIGLEEKTKKTQKMQPCKIIQRIIQSERQ